MKTCPACGLHVEDDYLYCWEDGTRLSGTETRLLAQRSTAPLASEELATSLLVASDAIDEQRVLSCPVCGGEFPLTFTACPVHDLPLTSKRMSRVGAVARASVAIVDEPIAQVLVSDEAMLPGEPIEDNDVDISDETQRQNDRIDFPDETQSQEVAGYATSPSGGSWPAATRWSEIQDRTTALLKWITGVRHASKDRLFGRAASVDSQQTGAPRGMRLAARATAIALGLFTLGALYLFYRQVTRTPSRTARASAAKSGPTQLAQTESPLIATPPEARDYREEPATAAQPLADEETAPQAPQKQAPGFRVPSDTAAPRTSVPSPDRSTTSTQATTQPSGTSDPVPPAASGRFNAQLVRVRSYKAPSGYNYTLTFTLYEHAGRPMKWERLSIVTHSASGATRTEMIPFQHWLAGSGALTFTVNVDMAGPSEDDWRGRISCMSVGADETGRPLRASFGTNVAP